MKDTAIVKELNVSLADFEKLNRLVRHSNQQQADTVPLGWFTTHKLAQAWHCSVEETRRRIRASLGLFETRMFRIQITPKTARTVIHYKLK